MKWSKALLPTLREVPTDAEIPSHQLMVRAGLTRKLAAGVYTYLPLGLRVIRKFENIVRSEMNRAGAQELLMPTMTPASLWQETGRWDVYGPELMRLTDRHGRQFALGPTHEEVITDLVRREVNSYKRLPLNLYQIQTKFRDEIRPRFGVMRGREFGMKDAYSFHTSPEDLDQTYWEMHQAYSNIFKRCGLHFRAVEAESGPIGGSSSHEFMVLADNGEDMVISCEQCQYAANVEKAALAYEPPPSEEPQPLAKVATPGQKTIDEVAAFLKVSPAKLMKTLVYQCDERLVVVLLRGDRILNEAKLKNQLEAESLELASAEQVEQLTSTEVGFAGPLNLEKVQILADLSLQGHANLVTGANELDTHYTNVNFERDLKVAEFHDLSAAQNGDLCPKCGDRYTETRGIEVGHIFKLGTKYSKALGAIYLDENGKSQTMIMGCYGIGIGRTVAASIEQNHDEHGIVWPMPLAPYQVVITSLDPKNIEVYQQSEKLYHELIAQDIEVLWDDRNERPGVKFKDADLIGIPIRINVGKRMLDEGKIELKLRHDQSCLKLAPIEVVNKTIELIKELSP